MECGEGDKKKKEKSRGEIKKKIIALILNLVYPTILETLASQGKITKEEAVHKYYLWGFKKATCKENGGD